MALAADAPPGVTRIVLAGGGAIVALLELLELELLDELDGDPQGSTATDCVSVLLGIVISFDPGGIVLAPDWTTAASEHEVTAIVNGLCWRGMTIVRTPGLVSAAPTGSWLELLDELPPLLPQPVMTTTAMHVARTATNRVAVERLLFMLLLLRGCCALARMWDDSPHLPAGTRSRNAGRQRWPPRWTVQPRPAA